MEEKINFVKWLGQKKSLFLKEGLFAIIFFVTFALYHLPLAAIFYPVLLCFVTGMLFLVWDYRKFAVRHERLQQLSAMPFDVMTDFPESLSVLETDYQPLNAQIMTDEKWLLFVIEQILSNALKYTQQGCVSIYLESPKILCIRDTGMGIAAEDLPRIFEKGYTGYNGRTDKKASGLGLYLCARICRNLGHGISAESEPDKGTVIKLNLNTAERMFE